MATVDDLHQIAVHFLTASVDALVYTDAGPPDRQYVSPGSPPIDCEQVVTCVQTLSEYDLISGSGALSRAHAVNRGGKPSALIQIQVVRCIPVPTDRNGKIILPTPAALQDAARMIDQDGWALWLGLSAAIKHEDGVLHDACSGAERLGGEKLVPQGAFCGWQFSYRVPLDGGVLST